MLPLGLQRGNAVGWGENYGAKRSRKPGFRGIHKRSNLRMDFYSRFRVRRGHRLLRAAVVELKTARHIGTAAGRQ